MLVCLLCVCDVFSFDICWFSVCLCVGVVCFRGLIFVAIFLEILSIHLYQMSTRLYCSVLPIVEYLHF